MDIVRRQLWPAVGLTLALTLITGHPVSRWPSRSSPRSPSRPRRTARSSRPRTAASWARASSARASASRSTSGAVSRRPAPTATTPTPRPAPTWGPRTPRSSSASQADVERLRAAHGDAPVPGRPRDHLGVGPRPAHQPRRPPSTRSSASRPPGAWTRTRCAALVARAHGAPLLGLPRSAAGQRPGAQPRRSTGCSHEPHCQADGTPAMSRPERDAFDVRPTAEEMLERLQAGARQRPRPPARLPGHGARASARPTACSRRAIVAPTAAPTSWSASWRPTGDRVRWEPWSRASRSCPAAASSTGASSSRRWTPTRVIARRPTVALVDELAHTNVPGSVRDEALAGRGGHPRRRHPRRQHPERAAPRVRRRRGGHHHRRSRQRAHPRRGPARAPTRSSSWT